MPQFRFALRPVLAVYTTSIVFSSLSSIALSGEPHVRTNTRESGWCCEASANFRVWTPRSTDAGHVAKTLELGLARQRADWRPDAAHENWHPKCVVVVHPNLAAYRRAIGSLRDSSVGMATFAAEKEMVTSRRIDLRCDADGWLTDALPHELTHLVLADAFDARPASPWVDEGLAVLSESSAKQAIRATVLERAIAARSTIPAPQLLSLERLPAAYQRDLFYSQSASLAAYLFKREGAAQFCEFVRQSREKGHETALRDVYSIDGTGHLDRLWQADSIARRAALLPTEKLVIDR